ATALNVRPATKRLTVSIPIKIRRNVRPPDRADAPASAWPGLVPSIWRTPSMTHLSPGGGFESPPPVWLSRQVLDQEIARRRARLVALEAEMIAACEVAALGAHPTTRATAARERWHGTA